MIGMNQYADAARQILDRVVETQAETIGEAAGLVADSVRANGVVQAFGTGHSRAMAMEIAGRAGGLIPTSRIGISDLVMLGGWDPKAVADPRIERDPAIAGELWALHRIDPADVFIVVSNSGGNGTTVELARLAREAGNPVIAITSVEHASQITSRHPSGRKLTDEATVVIDNGGPYGDALLGLPDGRKVCGVSTLSSTLIVQMLMAEVVGLLEGSGHRAPVYVSANVPGGDEHNDQLKAHYAGRLVTGGA